MFDGQSLGLTPFTSSQAYPAKFMAAAHPELPYHVVNRAGTTYAQRTTDVAGRVDYQFATTPGRIVVIDDGGTYDIDTANGNLSAANVLAAKLAYTTARRAAGADYIVGLTIPPATILTAAEETTRQSVNSSLKASPVTYGYDKIVDVASIPQLTNAADTNYYYDGVHWTDAATTLVAQALVDAGI